MNSKAQENRLLVFVNVYLLSIAIPSTISFDIVGARFSVYRLVLAALFLPLLLKYIQSAGKRICDFFVFSLSVLYVVSLLNSHSTAALAYSFSLVLETVVPYMLARMAVRDMESLKKILSVLIWIFAFIGIFSLFELATGYNIFHTGKVAGGSVRYGASRAFGPLDHPILLGLSGALVLGLMPLAGPVGFVKKTLVLLTVVTPLSSAALLQAVVQWVFWKVKVLRGASLGRIFLLGVIFWVVIDVLSTRPPLHVIASLASLDPWTAYYRVLILENGVLNIIEKPFFGRGLDDWIRPEWMVSSSIDNFYLVVGIRHGLIALLFLLGIIICALKSTYSFTDDVVATRLRAVLLVFAMIIFTVHLWNYMYTFLFFFIGICVNSGYYDGSLELRKDTNSDYS